MVIVRRHGKYCVMSRKKPRRNLGCSTTREGAVRRERQVNYFKHRGRRPPEPLEAWIDDVDPDPLARALEERDPELLAFAKDTQRELRKGPSWGEGYPDEIVLLRATGPHNRHWQGHEFSSWTSSLGVADEFSERLAEDGEHGDIVEMRIPVAHILAAGGHGGLADYGYATMDYEFVIMHNVPRKLNWKRLRVYREGEWA